jgi:Rho family protein
MNCINVKCVLVGDSGCGKSTLIVTYTTKKFKGNDICRVCENISTKIHVDGKKILLGMWDTSGLQDYPQFRAVAYPQTEVVLCIFSVVDPSSLKSVVYKYFPEAKQHCPNARFILVGTKTDLRDGPEKQTLYENISPVTYKEGTEIAKELGAQYMECSSRHQTGVSEIFEEAVRTVLYKDQHKYDREAEPVWRKKPKPPQRPTSPPPTYPPTEPPIIILPPPRPTLPPPTDSIPIQNRPEHRPLRQPNQFTPTSDTMTHSTPPPWQITRPSAVSLSVLDSYSNPNPEVSTTLYRNTI